MINIFIADDHALVREGVKKIINEETDMKVTGETNNSLEIVDKIKAGEYDALVLDISMPGKSGLDILKEIKIVKPKLPVLILSMHPEDRFAIRALKAGAAGYLTKESVPEELVNAIHKIIGGRKYISPFLAEKLASAIDSDSDRDPHENLSDREYQVMLMIASGKKVTEIGDELSLSIGTVNTYRTRIFEKMSFKSNIELTHYVIENKLLD
jgi:DNA-binding NarL/FixJ family response regulator